MKKIITFSLLLCSISFTQAQQCKIQGMYGQANTIYNGDGSPNAAYYIVPGKGDLYGICDSSGKMIVPAQYDMYFTISNGKVVAKNNAKKIVDLWDLTTAKKVKLPGVSAGDIVGDNGLIALQFATKKWGYCNLSGKTIIPGKFSYAEGFSNGRAFASAGELYGMIDEKGNWLIKPKRIAYTRLSPTLIFLRDETGTNVEKGLMDNNGKIIVAPKTYREFELRNGFVEALNENNQGALFNYSGKQLTGDDCKVMDYPNKLDAINGLITVQKPNGYVFLLDTSGQKLLDNNTWYNLTWLMYASNMQFSNLYKADSKPYKLGEQHQGNYKLVKTDGSILLDGNFSDIIAVNDDLFFTATGNGDAKLVSLQKADGTVLAKDLCNEISGFHKQYATIRKGDKFGAIDVFTGQVLIPLEYVNILAFDDCAISLTHTDGSRVEFDQQLKKRN